MQSIIVPTLYLLTSLIPLVFTTINSELFEFPKFILLISGTLVITLAWALHLYQTKSPLSSIISQPSPITLSILAMLALQLLATIFSIHPYTSFWGYYSRYHQGLLTTICYTIIYFAALYWLDNKSTQKLIKISVSTAFLISLYAIAEHFGIDKSIWIQDVQNRVFSTLGQPNWLAAYLIPNFFLVLYLSQINQNKYPTLLYAVSCTLFTVLLFTKSRSGLLAFSLSLLTYYLLQMRQFGFAKIKNNLLSVAGFLVLSCALLGTSFTPSISDLIKPTATPVTVISQGTALENGGTESGDIRKIVWEGALRLIARHPLFGTGPETFSYTYYWERPTSHNLTSEWDFLYNKAHNEYLNIAAGSGIIGLLVYLALHLAIFRTSLTIIPKSKSVKDYESDRLRAIYPVLGASIVGFTITNFFGFSVIPVYLLMILIAVMPSGLTDPGSKSTPRSGIESKTSIIHYSIFIILALLVLLCPAKLFLADVAYAKGKTYLDASRPTEAIPPLIRATNYRPHEALFHSSLGEAYALLALGSFQSKDQGQLALVQKYESLAVTEAEITRALNPYHLNYFKSRAKIYLMLAVINPQYNEKGALELEDARKLAPTDPKLAYNLGLVYTRLSKAQTAEENFRAAISLKPNYADPYYALTLLFEQTKQEDKLSELLSSAKTNLATYSSQLQEKIDKYLTN